MRTTSLPSKVVGATQARPEATTRRTSALTSPKSSGGTASSTAKAESLAIVHPRPSSRSLTPRHDFHAALHMGPQPLPAGGRQREK